MSEMGLIQMTRKRTREPLTRILCEPCFYCEGEGYLISRQSICFNIYREILRDILDLNGGRLTLRVNPEIAEFLHGEENEIVTSLERQIGKQIVIYPNPQFHMEEFDGSIFIRLHSLPRSAAFELSLFPEYQDSIFEKFPPDTRFTVVERIASPWGNRVIFEESSVSQFEDLSPRSPRVLTVPIKGVNGTLGFVELSDGPNFAQEALITSGQAFVIAAGGAVILAGIVGWMLARRLTAPLQDLIGVTDKMGAGDLSVRATKYRPDEIGQLATQFNQMADQIEASFSDLASERDALRRFVADASHELRTPITAIKSFIDLMQGPAIGDEGARQDFLQESRVQVERLEWITQNLLDLSRFDAGLVDLEISFHEVEEIIRSVVGLYTPFAEARQVVLNVAPPDTPISFQGDRGRLEVALGNLVDNGLLLG